MSIIHHAMMKIQKLHEYNFFVKQSDIINGLEHHMCKSRRRFKVNNATTLTCFDLLI
jgi:hypothetical protein